MKLFLFSFILIPGLGYDIEDVFLVTDSTFIDKIKQQNHRHHEKEEYSDLNNKTSDTSSVEPRSEIASKKFEHCDAYLNSGEWKKTIEEDTLRNCSRIKACRESRFDRSRNCPS